MSESLADDHFAAGKYEDAIEQYWKTLRVSKELAPEVVARLHRKIGNCYRRLGKFHSSIEEYEVGLRVLANAQTTTREIKLEMSRLYYEKAICYWLSDPMTLAEHYAAASQKLLTPYKDEVKQSVRSELGNVHQLLAILAREQDDRKQFNQNLDEAQRHFDAAGDSKNSLLIKFNRNVERLLSGNFQEPIDFFEAELPRIQRQIPNWVSGTHLNLALAYIDKEELDPAQSCAEKSLEAAIQSKDPIGKQRAYEALAEISRDRVAAAVSRGERAQAESFAAEAQGFIGKGLAVGHDMQGGESEEYEYLSFLIHSEVKIWLGDLDRAENLLNDAISFTIDHPQLKLLPDSRARLHEVRALLYKAQADDSTLAEVVRRYLIDATRELENAGSILESGHQYGKLVRVNIERAKLEMQLGNSQAAVNILDPVIDTAQEYKRDNDIEATLELLSTILKQPNEINEINSIALNRKIIQITKISTDQSQIGVEYRVGLFNEMIKRFDLEELREICFKLDISYDEFKQRRSTMARELILYLSRRDRICDLYCYVKTLRENITLEMPDCDCTSEPDHSS